MVPRRSVLVVDALEETPAVLRAALEPQGVAVFSARRAAEGRELAAAVEPDVIVFDLESDDGQLLAGPADDENHSADRPLVLLGTMRRQVPACHQGQFVAKPYHYAPLIRKIEALLEQSRPTPASDQRKAA